MTLDREQKSLIALNVLGGTAVLASYVLAFVYSSEIRTGLWGGVPESLRVLYTPCMFVAAAGYFPFSYLLIMRTSADELATLVGWPYRTLHLAYALILIPSAAWLPLTAQMLAAPSSGLWWTIRVVLLLVAAGATALLVALIAIARKRGGVLPWVAVAGCTAFWFQTAILDATIWPAYFPFEP